MNIEINGKKEKIPLIDELTVSQYIKFMKTKRDIIDYLSIVLNIKYKEAFDLKFKGLKPLLKRLGDIKDYSKIKMPGKLIINNKLYFTRNIEISTIGQRFMIEENAKKLKDEEYLCFVLAVGIVKNPMDIEEINEMKNILMRESYLNVLPTAFFLFSHFMLGKKSAMNYFNRLKKLISMKVYAFRLALTS